MERFPCFLTALFERDPLLCEPEPYGLAFNLHTGVSGSTITGVMLAPGGGRDERQQLPDYRSIGRSVDDDEVLRQVLHQWSVEEQGGLPLPMIDHFDRWASILTRAEAIASQGKRRRYTYLRDDHLQEVAVHYVSEVRAAAEQGRKATPTKVVGEVMSVNAKTAERWVTRARIQINELLEEQ